MSELRAAALEALAIGDPQSRCDAVRALSSTQSLDSRVQLVPSCPVPGRPARPRLVAPHQVPQRAVQSTDGRAALLHAVAHIEFNAIGLALDEQKVDAVPHADYDERVDWVLTPSGRLRCGT